MTVIGNPEYCENYCEIQHGNIWRSAQILKSEKNNPCSWGPSYEKKNSNGTGRSSIKYQRSNSNLLAFLPRIFNQIFTPLFVPFFCFSRRDQCHGFDDVRIMEAVFRTFKQHSAIIKSTNVPCSWGARLNVIWWDIQYVRQLLIEINKCLGGAIIQQYTSRQNIVQQQNGSSDVHSQPARASEIENSINFQTIGDLNTCIFLASRDWPNSW